MPAFSATSQKRLATCHPDLQRLFNEVIQHWDCSILCGHRGEEEQEKAYQNKHSTKHWPQSKHNTQPSIAVDAAPYPVRWSDIERFREFAGFVKGIAAARGIKIRSGGDWDMDNDFSDQKFIDLPHFELVQ